MTRIAAPSGRSSCAVRARRRSAAVVSLAVAAAATSLAPGAARAATWNGGAGNWNVAANWTGGIPDAAGETAAIDGGNPAASTVTLDTSPTISSFTLDAGDALIIDTSRTLTLSAGGTVNGALSLASTGGFSILRLNGAQTLSGGGQIVFAGTTSSPNLIDGTGPVTIGPALIVRTGAQGGTIRPAALTNQGRLSAETAVKLLTLDPTTFVNQGTVQVSAGIFDLAATSWTNTGRIDVSGAGLLRIGGTVTTAGLNLPGFVRTGGTIDVTGVVNNTGAVLALAANTGSFNLRGGTLRGGTVTTTGGAALAIPADTSATLDAVNLDTDVNVGNSTTVTVLNGLGVAAGRTLTLASTGGFSILRFTGAQALSGGGHVAFGGSTSSPNLIDGAGPLTIGPAMTVRTGLQGGTIRPAALTNQGVLSAETAAKTLTIDPMTFVNQGTVRTSAGTLDLAPGSWTNTGRIDVSGTGLLRLGGTVTTAGLNLPGFARSGGTIDVTGVINNAGNTLALAPNTGTFNLRGGTIRGGTVTASGGAALLIPADTTATLDGTNLDTDVTVGNSTTVTVLNGLGVAPGRTLTLASTGGFSVLRFTGAQTLSGGGQVAFGGSTSSPNLIDGAGPLTVGPAMTLRTGAQGGTVRPAALINQGRLSAETAAKVFTLDPTTFVNQGTVQVSAGTFDVNPGSWTNTGRIDVSGAGLLRLGGTVTTAGLNLPGFTRSGGTVDVTGTLNNSGVVLALAANTGPFNLRGGTLRGGTVTASGGAALVIPADTSATLDGTNLDTDVTVGNSTTVTVVNGLGVGAGRTLTLASTGGFSVLRFTGPQSLSGGGQVVFAGSASSPNLIDGTGPLMIGPAMTVRTGAQGGTIRPGALTNQGLLSAQTPAMTITVDPTTFLNQGTVRASSGTMSIAAASWTNTGTFDVSGTGLLRLGGSFNTAGINLQGFVRTGGAVDLAGVLNNASSTLALAANTGSFNLRGGTILGGTVTTTGGAALLVPADTTGTLDGVTLDTDVSVGNSTTVTVLNGLTVPAGRTLTLASTGGFSVLRFTGPQSLAGGGQVVFGGSSSSPNLIDGTGPLTIGPAMTVRTGFQGGTIRPAALTNQGVLSAETAAKTLTIDPTTFVNHGTLRASAGGTLAVTVGVTGTGAVTAGPSGTVRAAFLRQTSASLFGTPGSPATFGQIRINPKSQGGQTSVLNALAFQLDAANKPVGGFDLADTALILEYAGASPLASVRAALVSGYAGGAWTGPGGIHSSSAAGNPSRAVGYAEASQVLGAAGGPFQGQAADGTAVLVRFTLAGDATLDGLVNFNDLVRLAQNYNTAPPGDGGWYNGDFTYDGLVNFNDLVKLAQNYNTALPSAGVPGAAAGFADDLARAMATVPEPHALATVAACGFAGLRARRRRA